MIAPGGRVQIIRPSAGDRNDTDRIQQALDDVGEAGGGMVLLRPGVYHVAPPDGRGEALRIRHDNVVLRGMGPNRTAIVNTEPVMRRKHVIRAAPPDATGRVWHRPADDAVALSQCAVNRATDIHLEDVSAFEAGQWIVLRQDVTDAFIEDHDMAGLWRMGMPGPAFYRRITGVSADHNTITIDIPLRYPLLTRDGARVHRVADHLEDVGVEHLSVAMVENTTGGYGATDYREDGTGAYEVHSAHALTFNHVVDGWIRNVHTARPPRNESNVHLVSNGILLAQSRNVTVADCIIQRPQYRGGGGNGYGITFQSSDCLVTNCRVTHSRHNYSFKSMYTTGNVVHRSRSEDAMLASDFHMHLSPANLFDMVTVNRDWLQARYRPWGTTVHGHPTTQSLFWNTIGEAGHRRMGDVIVESRQFDWGLVIGTQGPAHDVKTTPTRVNGTGGVPGRDTAPEDYAEGIGRGETLEPQSLYEDQLRRRLERE